MNNSKSTFLNYLVTVYDKCNEHLLEQGKKRDQLITFYIVILAFVITYHSAIEHQFFGSETMKILYPVVFFIGFIVVLILADLRSWHQQYIDCIRVLNWTFAHEQGFNSVESLKNKIHLLIEEEKKTTNSTPTFIMWFKKFFLGSTDNMAYTGIILLSSLTLLGSFYSWFPNYLIFDSIAYLICLFFYTTLLEVILQRNLQSASKYRTWILNFDYHSQKKLWENNYFAITVNNEKPIITQKNGGVVTIPVYDNKILFIKIRRIDNKSHWELPRGFKEKKDYDFIFGALRELSEETGIGHDLISEQNDLGLVMPDSGLINGDIHVVYLKINNLPKKILLQSSENLESYSFLNKEEIIKLIKSSEITDAFSLAGIAKFYATKN